MKLNKFQEERIREVLNVFEGSSVEPNYSGVYVFNDGRKGRKQVTLGRGFTEDSGSLGEVIGMYIDNTLGEYRDNIKRYRGMMGKGVLWNNPIFKQLLEVMGNDDVSFRRCQDFVFDSKYWDRGIRYNNLEVGGKLPLTMLVIQDSMLHGGIEIVRDLFPEKTPKNGGDEKAWAKAYCEARRKWWLNHAKNPHRAIVGKGTYRMDSILDSIKRGNWDLNLVVNANSVIV